MSLTWRKSSYTGSGNDCVEVACTDGQRWVRDSKHAGPQLTFADRKFARFLAWAVDHGKA